MFPSAYLHTPVGIKDVNQKNVYSSLHCIMKVNDFATQMWDLSYSTLSLLLKDIWSETLSFS